jgi:group I intron endonuclease
MEQITYIYTLSDPITGVVKYVGKTIKPKDRLRCHIKDAASNRRNNLSCNWIKSLLKKGLVPKMDIIDETYGSWEWLEMYWISQFKTWGFKLKNTTDGGDYNPMSNPISRKKLSDKLTGVSKSQNHKNSISKTKIGVSIHSEIQKVKYSNMNSGDGNPMYNKKHTTDALQKMKLSVLQYTLDGDFIKEWSSAADIERETDMLARSINRCAKGDRPTAYGYKWEYKNKKGRG